MPTKNFEAPRIVRFGVFELDLHSQELRRRGLKVKLSAQPFQVLALLLEHPGNLVTREELRQKLWPSDTFVDFDHGLNAAVRRLRDALGDSAQNPSFIETVARLGYRFIGSTEMSSGPDRPIQRARWSLAWRTVAVAVMACILVAITHKWLGTTSQITQMSLSPLVTYPGLAFSSSLSPSGQQVVFSWNGGSGTAFGLYEKVIGSEQSVRLTNAPAAIDFNPVWSPDGREIAFARIMNGNTGIYKISALGGPERKVLATAWRDAGIDGAFWAPGRLDWSPDGNTIVFSDRTPGDRPAALFLLSLATMQTRRLTSAQFEEGDINPRFSPDGQTVAFVRDTTGGESVYVVPSSGGRERLVSSEPGSKVGLDWTSDGRNLVFGGGSLWKVPIVGGPPERLPLGQDGYQPSIRGNRIAHTQATWNDSIWRRRLGPTNGSEGAQRFITSTRIDAGPQFSPDGSKIVYQSNRSGVFQIWLCNSDGTSARQLTNLNAAWTGTPRWSPDGRFIVFDSRPTGQSDIFVVDAEGGPPRRLTSNPSNEAVPSWSKDGRWIYFASDRSGRWEVWRVPAPGGDALPVTHLGGFAAFESLDGKTLYYTKGLSVPGIWKVPTSGGEESEVLRMPETGFFKSDGMMKLSPRRGARCSWIPCRWESAPL